MATLLLRTTQQSLRRVVQLPRFLTATRVYSSLHEPSYVDPHKGKVASDDAELPDQLGHAVGKERYELLCKLYGWDDPYLLKPVHEGRGTWEDPYIVYTWDEERYHWCQCENTGQEHVYQISLVRNIPKRCQCGYWFKLTRAKEPPFLKEFKWQGDGGPSAAH